MRRHNILEVLVQKMNNGQIPTFQNRFWTPSAVHRWISLNDQ